MSLVKCKECGHQVSTKADNCPSCGAKVKSSAGCLTVGLYCFIGFVALGVLGNIVNYFTEDPPKPRPQTKQTVTKTPKNNKVVAIDGNKVINSNNLTVANTPTTKKTVAPKLHPKPRTPWRYRHSDHSMSGGRVHYADTKSLNTVNFSFPYNGSQRAELQLRTHPEFGKDLIVSIPKGQFLVRSYEDTKVRVKFDDAAATSYKVIGAADHSSNVLFFRDYHGFVGKMLKAKKVLISIPVYQEGNPVFEFNVRNFDTDEYLER